MVVGASPVPCWFFGKRMLSIAHGNAPGEHFLSFAMYRICTYFPKTVSFQGGRTSVLPPAPACLPRASRLRGRQPRKRQLPTRGADAAGKDAWKMWAAGGKTGSPACSDTPWLWQDDSSHICSFQIQRRLKKKKKYYLSSWHL